MTDTTGTTTGDTGSATAGEAGTSAADLARGVLRLLDDMGFAGLTEVPLANGRRADVMALDGKGAIVIVEIKTTLQDFRADGKWREYLDFCDTFYFAVPAAFPLDVLPADRGLMVADRYGATLVREGAESPVAGPRRRAVTLRLARLAARRLRGLEDPPA